MYLPNSFVDKYHIIEEGVREREGLFHPTRMNKSFVPPLKKFNNLVRAIQ